MHAIGRERGHCRVRNRGIVHSKPSPGTGKIPPCPATRPKYSTACAGSGEKRTGRACARRRGIIPAEPRDPLQIYSGEGLIRTLQRVQADNRERANTAVPNAVASYTSTPRPTSNVITAVLTYTTVCVNSEKSRTQAIRCQRAGTAVPGTAAPYTQKAVSTAKLKAFSHEILDQACSRFFGREEQKKPLLMKL